jgi:hypothetical protein
MVSLFADPQHSDPDGRYGAIETGAAEANIHPSSISDPWAGKTIGRV